MESVQAPFLQLDHFLIPHTRPSPFVSKILEPIFQSLSPLLANKELNFFFDGSALNRLTVRDFYFLGRINRASYRSFELFIRKMSQARNPTLNVSNASTTQIISYYAQEPFFPPLLLRSIGKHNLLNAQFLGIVKHKNISRLNRYNFSGSLARGFVEDPKNKKNFISFDLAVKNKDPSTDPSIFTLSYIIDGAKQDWYSCFSHKLTTDLQKTNLITPLFKYKEFTKIYIFTEIYVKISEIFENKAAECALSSNSSSFMQKIIQIKSPKLPSSSITHNHLDNYSLHKYLSKQEFSILRTVNSVCYQVKNPKKFNFSLFQNLLSGLDTRLISTSQMSNHFVQGFPMPLLLLQAFGRNNLLCAECLGQISDNFLTNMDTSNFKGPIATGSAIQNGKKSPFIAFHIARRDRQKFEALTTTLNGSQRARLYQSTPVLTLLYIQTSRNVWYPLHFENSKTKKYLPEAPDILNIIKDIPFSPEDLFITTINLEDRMTSSGMDVLNLINDIVENKHPKYMLFEVNQPVEETTTVIPLALEPEPEEVMDLFRNQLNLDFSDNL